jgi:hypothetical protein
LRTNADEDRLIFAAQLVHQDISSHDAIAPQLDAEFENTLDLRIQHLARQAILRDAIAQQILRQQLTAQERRRSMEQIASPESLEKFVQDRRSAKTPARQKKRPQLPPAGNDNQGG